MVVTDDKKQPPDFKAGILPEMNTSQIETPQQPFSLQTEG